MNFLSGRKNGQVNRGMTVKPQSAAVGKERMNRGEAQSGQSSGVQAKLKIGPPNDQFEQEADQMADRVMRMPDPEAKPTEKVERTSQTAVQRKCTDCEGEEKKEEVQTVQKKELLGIRTNGSDAPADDANGKKSLRENITVQRKMTSSSIGGFADNTLIGRRNTHGGLSVVEARKTNQKIQRKKEDEEIQKANSDRGRGPPIGDFSSELNQSKGSGQPLDSATNSFMSSRFGADFSGVRIHTGHEAAKMSDSIQAKAFTHQNHIYFNKGQYQPNTHAGKTLLAHELTHTIQQGAVSNQTTDATGSSINRKSKSSEPREVDMRSNLGALSGAEVQPKLEIGPTNDQYEQEADAMADLVLRSPAKEKKIMRKCASCEKEQVQRKSWEKEEEYNPFHSKSSTNRGPLAVQRKCSKCNEESIQRKTLTNDEWEALKADILAYKAKLEGDDGATKAAIEKKIKKLLAKHGASGSISVSKIVGRGVYQLAMPHTTFETFELLMAVSERWANGKAYVVDQMNNLPIPNRNKEGVEREIERIRVGFPFDQLKVKTRDPRRKYEKPGWDISGKIKSMSKKVITGVDDMTNIVDGSTVEQAIAIKWYKPPKRYPQKIKLKNRKKGKGRVQLINTADKLPYKRKHVDIGVTKTGKGFSGGGGSRLVVEGDILTRTKSDRHKSQEPQRTYRAALTKCGYNWKQNDADHVVDLGFGGYDRYDNLWPLTSRVNRRAYKDKYYFNYKVVYKKNDKESEISPISKLYGKKFRIAGFFNTIPKPYPLGGIQRKLKENKAPIEVKQKSKNLKSVVQPKVLKGCDDVDEKTRKEQDKKAKADDKKGLKAKLKEFQIKAKHKMKAFKAKIKDLFSEIKIRFKKLLSHKKGKNFSSWGNGLPGALARAAFKIIKVVAKILIVETFDILKEGLMNNIDKVINNFKNDLKGDVPELEKKIIKMEQYYNGLRDKFQQGVDVVVNMLVSPFESYLKEFERIKNMLENVSRLINAAKWIYRVVACVSPPLVGCLWIAVQALGEALMEKIVSSCKFQKKIAPTILKLELVKDIPVALANLFTDTIKPIIPVELHGFFPKVKPRAISVSKLNCGGKLTPAQLAFMKLQEELGEEKIKALELLMKKGGIPDSTPFDMAAVQRIVATVKDAGLSAKEIEDLAKNYNPNQSSGNAKTVTLRKLLEQLQDHTGVSKKKKKSGVNKATGQLKVINELRHLGNWFTLNEKTGEISFKHNFNKEFKSFNITWTFSNNLVIKFGDESKISMKSKEFDFGKGKEKVQWVKFNLDLFAEIIPPHIANIQRGDQFKFRDELIWRVKKRKVEGIKGSRIPRKMDELIEVIGGKVKLKDGIAGTEVDLGEITAVIVGIAGQRKKKGVIDYWVNIVPKSIKEKGANYFVGDKINYFKVDKKEKLPFRVQSGDDKTVQKKLKIGNVDDPLEKEADQMADLVVRNSTNDNLVTRSPAKENRIMRKCNSCEEETLQRKTWEKEEVYNPYLTVSNQTKVQRKCSKCAEEEETIQRSGSGAFQPSSNFESGLKGTKGSGSPMDASTQSFMENSFGADFSNIKIHTGAKASDLNNQINAKAFTSGNDIYFNQGEYNPGTANGKHLLAHELTHTLQQGGDKKVRRTPYEEGERIQSIATAGQVEMTTSPYGMSLYAYAINESWMKPEHMEALNELASLLLANPEFSVEIMGHSDSIGSEANNDDLSEDRAKFVGGYLRALGVENVYETWAGESDPLTSNDSISDRMLNRRVEIVIYGMTPDYVGVDYDIKRNTDEPEITPEMREAFCVEHPWICSILGTGVALTTLIIAFCASNPQICALPVVPLIGGPPGPPGGEIPERPEPETPEPEESEPEPEEERIGENPIKASTAHAFLPLRGRLNTTYYSDTIVRLPGGHTDSAGVGMYTPYLTNHPGKIGEGSDKIRSKQKNIYGQNKLPTKGILKKDYNGHMVFIKGHLLNHRVGGPAEDTNLFPITQQANKDHEVGPEKWVLDNVLGQGSVQDGGNLVYYRVDVANRTEPTLIDVFGDESCVFYYIDSDLVCSYSTYRLLESGRIEQNRIIRERVYSRMQHEAFAALVREKVAAGEITCGVRGESQIRNEDEVRAEELRERLRRIDPLMTDFCGKAVLKAILARVSDYNYHPMSVGYYGETRTRDEEIFKILLEVGAYDRNAKEIFDSFYRDEMSDEELIDVLKELGRLICQSLEIIQSRGSSGMGFTHPNFMLLHHDNLRKMRDPSTMLYYFREVYALEAPESLPLPTPTPRPEPVATAIQTRLKDDNTIQRTTQKLPRKDLHVKGILDIAEQKMNKVYFEESSYKVGFLQEMKIASMFIGKSPPQEIFLYGYASEEGSKRFNKRLINKRLRAVKKLVEFYGGGKVKIHTEARLDESKNSYKYREFRAVEMSKGSIAPTNGVANTKDRDCSKIEKEEIERHRVRALSDVKKAQKLVEGYFYVPKSYPEVETLLDFYFGGHDTNIIAHVLQVLKEMKNDLPKLNGNKVLRCAGFEHAFCNKTYALADRQTDILFCPKFFNAKEVTFKTRVLIHELGHFILTNLRDYAYAHSRVFRFTSPGDALKNSDSYTMLINDINKHVVKSKKNTKRDPVGDAVNSCGKNQAMVEEALSRAERLNSFAVAGMKQTYSNTKNMKDMKPYLTKRFGKVNKYSLAGLHDRANKLKNIYRGQKFVLNCLAKGNAVCTKGLASILNSKREIDICPAFFKLSKQDQIIAIGAEVTKFVSEIQDKYRKSYVRIGQDYKTHFWGL